MDYPLAWQRAVEGFRALADACGPPLGVRVSLEFKPTDETTRHTLVPSTGAGEAVEGWWCWRDEAADLVFVLVR